MDLEEEKGTPEDGKEAPKPEQPSEAPGPEQKEPVEEKEALPAEEKEGEEGQNNGAEPGPEEEPPVPEVVCGTIRQPIVSVLGHVDHGKTTILDKIRFTTVASREAGLITQHIGATEVPIQNILDRCKGMFAKGSRFTVPGLLFIDTPGHKAFTTLRSRGGSLADLAVLVVDIMEGLMPQTRESINILKRYKTPFVIAANKVDRISGWRAIEGSSFRKSFAEQSPRVQEELENKIYKLIEELGREGVPADRYDRIEDFTKTFAIVPMTAKLDEGVSDLLLVLVGLAQRFLEKNLKLETGPAKATVLEVKEEKGMGKTLDLIVFSGTLRKTDRVAIGTESRPIVTKVKALLKPKPMDEIRDPRDRFDSVECVSAAAGIKLSVQDVEGVIAGAPLRVISDGTEAEITAELTKEMQVDIRYDDEGIMVKADAIGSLEAMAFEMHEMKIPIKSGGIGHISRREVTDVGTITDPLHKVIFGFSVKMAPEAEALAKELDVKIFLSDIIYKIIEDYQAWTIVRKRELESSSRGEFCYPGMFKLLSDYVFRQKDPVIIGVRVLGGRIRTGQNLIREDGREVGKIKSIRSGEETRKEALLGQEVAVAIQGPTLGRQIKVEDILYVDIPECDVKELRKVELTLDEQDTLEKFLKIKQREKSFWGM
jgi:translation initiation factor 5B